MPRLATVEQLKAHLSSKVEGADSVLEIMLESAESFVERFCGRRFSPDPELVEIEPEKEGDPATFVDTADPITKTVVVTPKDRLVRIPDLREVVSVELGGMELYPADYMLGNYSASSPQTQIELLQTAVPSLTQPETPLAITGKFGFFPTPPDIIDAVLTIAARRYRERDAAFSDVVQGFEGAAVSYFRQLPSNVQMILRSYKAPRIAVLEAPEPAIR